MSTFRKPRRLVPGDRVAILSPSWGGPACYPAIYELGLSVIREHLGLVPVEYPTARMPSQELYAHPELRARDVNDAFSDDSIAGIIASIGGSDSVRILPFLSVPQIIAHPKVMIGYSDFTTLLSYVNCLGNVTLHGPSVMAGFAQAPALGAAYLEHLRTMLFGEQGGFDYSAWPQYSEGYPDFGVQETLGGTRPALPDRGWDWAQRGTSRSGYIWGGCIEVLEFLKGTDFWPERSFFDDKFLFFETSEDKPSVREVTYWLRNCGSQTILNRVRGVIFGRPQKYSEAEKAELKAAAISVIVGEFGCSDIPIVMNFDAGHTDPQSLLPFGIRTEINGEQSRISLTEGLFAYE